MSLSELKQEAARLSPQERLDLAAFLAELDEEKEGEFRQTVDRRMRDMDAGKKVTATDIESEHARRLRPSTGG